VKCDGDGDVSIWQRSRVATETVAFVQLYKVKDVKSKIILGIVQDFLPL